MALYNLSWVNSTNTIMDLASATNTLSGGSFFPLVNILVLVIFSISMKGYEWDSAILAASLINLIITSLFYFVGLVGDTSLFINLALVFCALIYKAFAK